MTSEQFSLCWDNFHKNMSTGMQSLLANEDLVDVTLAVEGRQLKAHKMVLSVCSPYFRELFQNNPCQHPIVFMKDVSYVSLSDLLQFMYQGEVQVAEKNLTTFIKTAEALQIKGLTADEVQDSEEPETTEVENPIVESSVKRNFELAPKSTPTARVRRPSGPASKRPKLATTPSIDATSTPGVVPTSAISIVPKTDIPSTPTSEMIDFKMEPENPNQVQAELLDESQGTGYGDETALDDTQDDADDYALMEATDDEPKAGTSADGSGEGQGFFKFIVQQSGTHDLVVHQHIYRLVKLMNGRKHWSCANLNDCPAKCTTVPGKLLSKIGTHNHPPPKNLLLQMEKKGLLVHKHLD